MRYFIVAGELSGDNHAAALVREIRDRDSDAFVAGWGGDAMMVEGVEILRHIRELSVMGVWEVVSSIFRMRRLLHECRKDIERLSPDVVVFVDYGGFNLRLAKTLSNCDTKISYYIPPKIWAWGKSRLRAIDRYTDQILLILPFELDFYHRRCVSAYYVGNPVVEHVKRYKLWSSVVPSDKKVIRVAVLPGSRIQEIKKMLPLIIQLANQNRGIQFIVSQVSTIKSVYYQTLRDVPNIQVSTSKVYDIVTSSNVAIVTSGTATLEVALLNVPQVVVYKTSWLTYLFAKGFVSVSFISLVNLIAQRAIVTELIQEEYNLNNLHRELHALLNDRIKYKKISEGYSEIRNILTDKSASKNAAELICSLCRS